MANDSQVSAPSNRIISKILLILLGAGLTLLLACPAYWVGQIVANITGERVQLVNAQGSLWQGRTMIALQTQKGLRLVPGVLEWSMQRAGWQGVQIDVTHPQLAVPLVLNISLKRTDQRFLSGVLSWSQGTIQLPAQWLQSLGAPWNTLRPEGLIQLGWPESNTQSTLSAKLIWKDAQSALTPVRPLGEYVLDMTQTVEGNGSLTLSSNAGPLRLEGSGQWSPQTGWQFEGYARSEPSQSDALKGFLSQLGRQEGDRYRLNF